MEDIECVDSGGGDLEKSVKTVGEGDDHRDVSKPSDGIVSPTQIDDVIVAPDDCIDNTEQTENESIENKEDYTSDNALGYDGDDEKDNGEMQTTPTETEDTGETQTTPSQAEENGETQTTPSQAEENGETQTMPTEAEENGVTQTTPTEAVDNIVNTGCTDNTETAAEKIMEVPNDREIDLDATSDTKNEWMDILGNGVLKKKICKAGAGQKSRPTRGQLVTLKCEGYLENGDKIEDSPSLQFILGDGDVIHAFDLAVAIMELGEVCTLLSDSRFAYGDQGRDPDIPGGAKLRFELELLKVEEEPDVYLMDTIERLFYGNKKRERGNVLYLRCEYSSAINSYTKALSFLETDEGGVNESEYKDIEELKIKCYNNLAACQLKVEAYEAALKSCNSVLNVEPENVKALFRKAKVLANKGDLEDAVIHMRKAIKLEPSNKTIHQELSKLVVKLGEQMKSTKEMCKKMVGDLADSATKQTTKKSSPNSLFSSSGFLFGAALVGIGAVVTSIIVALK